MARAKTPIATTELAIMTNQAHMTATLAQLPIVRIAQSDKAAKARSGKIDRIVASTCAEEMAPGGLYKPRRGGTRPRRDLDPLETCSWRGVTAILSFGLGRAIIKALIKID